MSKLLAQKKKGNTMGRIRKGHMRNEFMHKLYHVTMTHEEQAKSMMHIFQNSNAKSVS